MKVIDWWGRSWCSNLKKKGKSVENMGGVIMETEFEINQIKLVLLWMATTGGWRLFWGI
jgi:hypothetical protein